MIKPDELGAEGQWVRLTVLAVALVLMTAGCGGSEPASVKPVSAPTYVVPDPGTVKDYDGYWRQACGPAIPADRVDLAAPRAVTGDAGSPGPGASTTRAARWP